MSKADVLQYMREQMKSEGIGKLKYSRKYKIDYAHLCRVFSGKANPGPSFLKRIGLVRVQKQQAQYEYVQAEN